ncbi:GntR family transcriptional regulator [Arthrobacter sp. STN4]|uniref:GntR family transcriptional regulator n=1 Tax=Arthrobacter sp. STN4 TaxID=2923276 RepID=UPI00211A9AC3|nr:GntR family transcriptional regulator [Arthrobacter sp. STN4]MCQ9164487.1 GntR family transcriptional regulator [Arthrobacter sp. STN4]
MPTPPEVTRHDGDSIYHELRGEILTGVLKPATPLREVALSERFGVSRTPVRDALRRLKHDKLLEQGVRGLQVHQATPQEVIQVYDVRILLEKEVAAQAARAHDVTDVMRLEGLLARDRALTAPDDGTRAATNMEFHAAVWAAAHNPVLEDLLQRLTTHLIRTPHSTLSVGTRWEEALDEHGRLVEAIDAGDESSARDIAGAHMESARSLRLGLLRDSISHP